MRPLIALTLLGILVSACTSEPLTTASPSPTSDPTSAPPTSNPSATMSPTATPSLPSAVDVPKDAPTAYGRPVGPDEVPVRALLPPGGRATTVLRVPSSPGVAAQILVAWMRGTDPLFAQRGFEVWQRLPGDPPWRVVFALTDPPSKFVYVVSFDSGDLTGDQTPDALAFEDMDGSGGCGVWTVVMIGTGSASAIFRRHTCDTQVQIASRRLSIRSAVFQPSDAHCCPSNFRTTTLAWDGESWVVVSRVLTPAG